MAESVNNRNLMDYRRHVIHTTHSLHAWSLVEASLSFMNMRTVRLFGQSTLEDAVKAIDPPLNDTLPLSWMAALLVTVPLCPLYNPGNPRQGAALLVVARRGNGAGQSAAGGAAAQR